MTNPSEPRTPTFVGFESEVVIKPDGRYLIYYSWPDEPMSPAEGEPSRGTDRRRTAGPADPQAPWSPESGPPASGRTGAGRGDV